MSTHLHGVQCFIHSGRSIIIVLNVTVTIDFTHFEPGLIVIALDLDLHSPSGYQSNDTLNLHLQVSALIFLTLVSTDLYKRVPQTQKQADFFRRRNYFYL